MATTTTHPFNSDSHPNLEDTISPDTARVLADELETLLNNPSPSIDEVKTILERTGRVGGKKSNAENWGDRDEYVLHFAGRHVLKELEALAAERLFNNRRILRVFGKRRNRETKEVEVLCSFLLGENIGTAKETWSPMAAENVEWLPYDQVVKVVPDLIEEIEP